MTTRRSKRHSSGKSGPETAEQMLQRVLGAFDRWFIERERDSNRLHEVSDVVRTACELKSSALGEPNPADWDPQSAVHVVGEVFPAKVLGVDRQYAGAVIPGMLLFIDFLTETGRWKPHNDAAATRAALTALAPALPDRFTDPSRLSMGGRIVQLAIDEGIDVSDPAALAGFMQRFNEMPFEWRKRLTDPPDTVDLTGAAHSRIGESLLGHSPLGDRPLGDRPLGDAGRYQRAHRSAFDSPEVLEELNEAILAAAMAVGFTGEPVVITVPDADTELARLSEIPLVTRMAALAEWVRPGRKVTTTGAIRRDDTADWLGRFGIRVVGSPVNSMWDHPEVAIPWSVAATLGLIDIATTKVYPGPDNDIFTAGAVSSRIRCGRAAVNLLLHNLIGSGDELTDLERAVTGLLLPLLACLCGSDGADLMPLRTLTERLFREPLVSPSNMMSAMVFRMVLTIVDRLQEWGVVSISGTTTAVPGELRPAVVGAIYAPGAPFTLRLEPGAVPFDA